MLSDMSSIRTQCQQQSEKNRSNLFKLLFQAIYWLRRTTLNWFSLVYFWLISSQTQRLETTNKPQSLKHIMGGWLSYRTDLIGRTPKVNYMVFHIIKHLHRWLMFPADLCISNLMLRLVRHSTDGAENRYPRYGSGLPLIFNDFCWPEVVCRKNFLTVQMVGQWEKLYMESLSLEVLKKNLGRCVSKTI